MGPGLWLPRIDFRPSIRLRLVTFSHAGAGAAPFLRWTDRMPPGVALCPVRYPGRETARSEPLLPDVHALAAGAFEALSTLPPRPLVLLGHSLGALVAYEVARRFEAESPQMVRLLVVSARGAPDLPPQMPLVGGLPDALFIEAVKARYGGIPPEIAREPELMRMVLPILRADLQASESYRPLPGPALSCPILACTGDADASVPVERLQGWRACTTSTCEQRRFRGGHFYLLAEESGFLDVLGERLGRELR